MYAETHGVILAGGLARRMGGGDKGLCEVGGRPVLRRVIDRMMPQLDRVVLNANGDAARFAAYGLPVVPDSLPDRPGPLAGVLAGLDWAAAHAPDCGWLVTVPADAPFLPPDLVVRLHAARRQFGAALACATSGGRTHWVVGLWSAWLRPELRQAIGSHGLRAVAGFAGRYDVAFVEWAVDELDPFVNVNTPADLSEAERLAAAYPDR